MNATDVTPSCTDRDRVNVMSHNDRDRGKSVCTLSQCESSSVLYVVAWATLGQALCFLVVAMFLDDVPILPSDPLTMIGTMYVVMGMLLMGTSCFLYKMKQPKAPACTEINNTINKSVISDDGKETCSQKESADCLKESGILDKNEHQTVHDLNITPLKDVSVSDLRSDPDGQWQMLDCGVRSRNKPETSNITSARET